MVYLNGRADMSFFRDLKIAVRSLARGRSLWITVAITLPLGIGVNAAIFSVVRGMLLRGWDFRAMAPASAISSSLIIDSKPLGYRIIQTQLTAPMPNFLFWNVNGK